MMSHISRDLIFSVLNEMEKLEHFQEEYLLLAGEFIDTGEDIP